MTVMILGAGVVGVATAYYLARNGVPVQVVDRQPGPGLETSFANGGQISANHATPWAAPGTPWKALNWLGKIDAPLLFHLRYDPALLAWLARFLRNCTRRRMKINVERALRLALYSREQLRELRAETALQYDQLTRGILHIFRNPEEYQSALPLLPLMNRLGCRRDIIDARVCVDLEPALAPVREELVGGIYSPDDESGDAYLFTSQLADICANLGVAFRFGTEVRSMRLAGNTITGIETDAGFVAADTIVIAMGSYSPLLVKPLGLRLPVYPAKGYSVTIPVDDQAKAPSVSLIDDEFKMVYSRLGSRLRIAGTAEFIGYDASVTDARARFLLETAMRLFPGCGDAQLAEFWAGLRPSTPDGVPVVGWTRYKNLFLNTGHGTLGWTMACGTGRIAADMVMGRVPEIDVSGLGIDRFE